MKGDFSRLRFDKGKHYSEVLMQQGRVQVDSDWNEQQAINQHRIEIEALDVIGRCGAPMNNPGFKITTDGTTLNIGRGRYYVDGILCENDSDITYDNQPDLPNPPDPTDVLKGLDSSYVGLVYLDVWQRHITALDDPLIREVALNGPDTTTRVKTIWQVKILPVANTDNPCDSQLDKLITPSTGTLNARTQPPSSADSLCLPLPKAGYQSLENQLYRIEIHKSGSLDTTTTPTTTTSTTPTFKWSRDNGSVVTAIENNISSGDTEIIVHDVGPDDILGFSGGQWAEIMDDVTELNGLPGELVQIDNVDPSTRKITLISPLTGSYNMQMHPKLRRWDMDPKSNGEIQIEMPTSNDGWISIENGIEVQFSKGNYNTGDYWLIPARTATGGIEWPTYEIPNTNTINNTSRQPLGIQHHYCQLALIQLNNNELSVQSDCRKIFPPLAEEPGIHILNVLTGDRLLFNDTEIPVNMLIEKGLNIEFDANIDPVTVKGTSTAQGIVQQPTCFITLDMPFPINSADRELWGNQEIAMIGFQPLILAADVNTEGEVVSWSPTDGSRYLLNNLFTKLSENNGTINHILAHLTLKGNFIWAQGNPELYLDGEVFGFHGFDKPNIDIHLPSGNSRRGGDFEMWFWLIPAAQIPTTIVISPSGVTLNVGDNPVLFTATARDQNGVPMKGVNISWIVGDPTFGNLSTLNAVTGVDGTATTTFLATAAGFTTVNAMSGSVSGKADVQIFPLGT